MSDHYPRTITSEQLSSLLTRAEDGGCIIRREPGGEGVHIGIKCSHVEEGACAECLLPTLSAYVEIRARLALAEERLLLISRYRESCHAHDDDMGHPRRAFDDSEEWDRVESLAAAWRSFPGEGQR